MSLENYGQFLVTLDKDEVYSAKFHLKDLRVQTLRQWQRLSPTQRLLRLQAAYWARLEARGVLSVCGREVGKSGKDPWYQL